MLVQAFLLFCYIVNFKKLAIDKLHILYIMIYKQYILLTVAECDDRTLRGG